MSSSVSSLSSGLVSAMRAISSGAERAEVGVDKDNDADNSGAQSVKAAAYTGASPKNSTVSFSA